MMKSNIKLQFISITLCLAMLLSLAVPVFAAENAGIISDADAQTVVISKGSEVTTDEIASFSGYDPEYTVINYGTITGGSTELANQIKNCGTIAGGTFSGDVTNVAKAEESIWGYITGGMFTGDVDNTAETALSLAYITGGTFTAHVNNTGFITGGVFEETSSVYNRFIGMKDGVFKGSVTTERYPINGGTYSGDVTIEHLGTINNGTFTETASVTQKSIWTYINGGTFYCEINNIGNVTDGTFNAKFTNSGTVSYGVFNCDVVNEENGTIYSNPRAKFTYINGNVINNGLIYACDFSEESTVTGEGDTYVFVTFYIPTGIIVSYSDPAFPVKYFKYGENVQEALKRYDEEYGLDNSWLRYVDFDPLTNRVVPAVDIEPDRTFKLPIAQNRFVRTQNKDYDHEHEWDAPIFAWSRDYSAVTAAFICRVAGETHTVCRSSTVTYESGGETCADILYTATVEFEGQTYTNSKTAPNNTATGHNYGDPVFTWSDNGKSASALFTCLNDETHTLQMPAEVTEAVESPATCTEPGATTYTATVEFEDETYTDTKTISDIPALGHNYGTPVFTWSDDGKSASALFTCLNDETHTLQMPAEITEAVESAATCTEPGATTYTATVELDDKTYTDTKTISDIPALGHNYGTPVFTWSDDGKSASALFTCLNDETHTLQMPAEVTETVESPATCMEPGATTYTATVEFEDEAYTDTKTISDIPALGHNYGNPVFTWSDDGKSASALFTCANDETHTLQMSAEITDAVESAASCTEPGATTYTATVELGDKIYTDTKTLADIPALEHNYGEWQHTENNHRHECENCESYEQAEHTFSDWEVVKIATDTEEGLKMRVCTVCGYEETETIPCEKQPLRGDVNNNGIIDSGDATMILRSTVGEMELTPEQQTIADMNANSIVDAGDATLILRIIVGMKPEAR